MADFAVTAVGADRPGIVAALTERLLSVGGNLADVRAALLRGSFAMVLVVAVPDEISAADLEATLEPTARELGMGIWVGPAEPPATAPPGDACMISVYGADRPGIVSGMTAALAERQVNILDLSSRLVGDPSIYVLGIEAELPSGLSPEALEQALGPVADQHGVELSLRAMGDDVL